MPLRVGPQARAHCCSTVQAHSALTRTYAAISPALQIWTLYSSFDPVPITDSASARAMSTRGQLTSWPAGMVARNCSPMRPSDCGSLAFLTCVASRRAIIASGGMSSSLPFLVRRHRDKRLPSVCIPASSRQNQRCIRHSTAVQSYSGLTKAG